MRAVFVVAMRHGSVGREKPSETPAHFVRTSRGRGQRPAFWPIDSHLVAKAVNVSLNQADDVILRRMHFDKATKELARGHDAVDRLRETQRKMAERQAAAVARRDLVLRGLALIAIFGLLAHAVRNL